MEHFDIVGTEGKIHGRAINDHGILELSVSFPSPSGLNIIVGTTLDPDTSKHLLELREVAPDLFHAGMSFYCVLISGFSEGSLRGAINLCGGNTPASSKILRALEVVEGNP